MRFVKFLPLVGAIFLQISCSSLLYHPSGLVWHLPSKIGLEYTDHALVSQDGTKLHGWLIKKGHGPKKGLVLLYHGNAENITTHYLSFAWLAEHGYDLFVFDYRGYGKSEGKPSPKGLSDDANAALEYTYKLKLTYAYPQFIVVGQSLGGSLVLKVLSENHHAEKDIGLVILDSTFRSNSEVSAAVLRSHFVTAIFSPLAYVLMQDTHNASVEDLKRWKYPTLIVTHEHDPVVSSKLTQKIFHQLGPASKKWLWVRNDEFSGHINSFLSPRGPSNDRLLELLKTL